MWGLQRILYLEPDAHMFESKIPPLCYLEQICSLLMPQFTPPENGNLMLGLQGCREGMMSPLALHGPQALAAGHGPTAAGLGASPLWVHSLPSLQPVACYLTLMFRGGLGIAWSCRVTGWWTRRMLRHQDGGQAEQAPGAG